MHGLILNSFNRFVRDELGLTPAPAEYALDAAYPDHELARLVAETAGAASVEPEELLRRFGRYAAAVEFRRLYPDYYTEAGGTRTFLLGVEERIHELVRGAIPGAYPPHLRVVPLGAEGVVVTYTSERQLCSMLEGLIEGVAGYYGESFAISHVECMRRGDIACAVFVEPPQAFS